MCACAMARAEGAGMSINRRDRDGMLQHSACIDIVVITVAYIC